MVVLVTIFALLYCTDLSEEGAIVTMKQREMLSLIMLCTHFCFKFGFDDI